MSMTGLTVFDTTLQKTNALFNDIAEELGYPHQHREAYLTLRAVLHALRDRLPIEGAVHLGAILPMLVRGFYYEGWNPSHVPNKMHRAEFLDQIRTGLSFPLSMPIEDLVYLVWEHLERHTDPAALEHVLKTVPRDISSLFRLPALG